jgi:hypothetical protein
MSKWSHKEMPTAPITLAALTPKSKGKRRPPTLTPEQRAAASARLKARWADPEYRKRRDEAARKALAARLSTPEGKRQVVANLRANDEKRIRNLRVKLAENREERAERARRTMTELWASGRMGEIMRTRKISAKGMARRVAATKLHKARKRGFEVPISRRTEYKFWTAVKGLKAREAGRIMGLIR